MNIYAIETHSEKYSFIDQSLYTSLEAAKAYLDEYIEVWNKNCIPNFKYEKIEENTYRNNREKKFIETYYLKDE